MMMFATLDDLEGQVETSSSTRPTRRNADKIDVDKLVIVRGRIDHKEPGRDQARGAGRRALRADRGQVDKAREKIGREELRGAGLLLRGVLCVVPAVLVLRSSTSCAPWSCVTRANEELEPLGRRAVVVLGDDLPRCGSARRDDLRHALEGGAEVVPAAQSACRPVGRNRCVAVRERRRPLCAN